MDHLWRIVGANLLGFLLFLHGVRCSDKAPSYSFMHNATLAPAVSFYDYIIVGGGTAGCPLAATLSHNATVLLLERGGSPYGNPNITNLSSFGVPLSDLSPASPSQRFISEDGVINARARVLGGGTCLNAGFYTRASLDYVRKAGWNGQLVNESYKWVEKKVAFEPKLKSWQSAFRDGLIEAGVVPSNGFTFDHIYGTKIGGTIFDQNGHRHTAADLLEYSNRSGITVFLHATVPKILFADRRGQQRPRAHGVVFVDATGAQHRAYLNRGSNNEIIVSAGALGSPQLLMLSGIGPEKQLQAHNITVVMDQPMVGQAMSDNPMNAVVVPSPVQTEVSLIQVVGITEFGSYIEAASGSAFATGSTARDYGMFSPKLSAMPPKERTPEAPSKAIELMNDLDQAAFMGGFILEKVDGPVSTGQLELRTLDASDNPAVTFNYFKEPEDLRRCVQGISTVQKVIESKAFSTFRYKNSSMSALLNMTVNLLPKYLPKHRDVLNPLEQFCMDTVMTIWHYHGGCQVGRVVDGDYKVFGVEGLRVVDGSTFIYSPGTNPQATVMMLGRYMGVKILKERFRVRDEESK